MSFSITAMDAEDGALSPVVFPGSGSTFPIGTNVVIAVATDSGGWSVTNSFVVTVHDTTPPQITMCAPARTLSAEEGCGALVPDLTGEVQAADAVGIAAVRQAPAPGTALSLGASLITLTVQDAAGNVTECMAAVAVRDMTLPIIECSSNLVLECRTPAGSVGTFAVTASDNCQAVAVECSPRSGTVFAPGTNLVTCTATDGSTNRTSCTFTVAVVDTAPPVITCQTNLLLECSEAGGAAAAFAVTAVDVCDTNPVVNCSPPNGSRFGLGTNLVNCTATDFSGNQSSCVFTVAVVDATPPVLHCPGPTPINGECARPVEFSVTAVDACDGLVPVQCVPRPGTVLPLGENFVNCTARDSAGNSNRCDFIVHVADTLPPRIVCSPDKLVQVTGRNRTTVEWAVATSDECGVVVSVCTPPSGSVFQVGMTSVQCTATDGSGNRASCRFSVTVERLNLCPIPVAMVTPMCGSPAVPSGAIISPNNSNAVVILDGRLSSDPDGEPLAHQWQIDSGPLPIAFGPVATNHLAVGVYDIRLIVSDGRCDTSTVARVEVIPACEAVEELILQIHATSLERRAKRPLFASLKAACASLERGAFSASVGQLGAFQNKVRAQLDRDHPALVSEWTRATQAVMDALQPCD